MDTIGPPIKDENPQPSPDRHLTLQRNDDPSRTTFLSDDSHIGGLSSSLVTIRHPTNHEYPSSTTLQSNGSVYNASFMTSPSYDSSIEVLSYIAEVCLPGYSFALIVLRGFKRYVTRTPLPRVLQASPLMMTFCSLITWCVQCQMHDICPNSMNMARTKESLAVDAEDSLCENDISLLDWNSRMFPVRPQGVLKGLNTSFAATISHDPPETKQMTNEGKQGRFRREIGSNLFRRMTRARFTTSLEIRDPPTLPTPTPSPSQSMTVQTAIRERRTKIEQGIRGALESKATGTQFESELVSGRHGMLLHSDRQEHRPRFPSTLQSVLSNDLRCVVRCRGVSCNN